MPLSTLVTASLPPKADAAPNPKNPTLFNGVKRYFVVHGGLFSREDVLLSEIKAVDRMKQKQPGHDGLMCEMLWTDPQDASGRGPSKRVRAFSSSFGDCRLTCCAIRVLALALDRMLLDDGRNATQ